MYMTKRERKDLADAIRGAAEWIDAEWVRGCCTALKTNATARWLFYEMFKDDAIIWALNEYGDYNATYWSEGTYNYYEPDEASRHEEASPRRVLALLWLAHLVEEGAYPWV